MEKVQGCIPTMAESMMHDADAQILFLKAVAEHQKGRIDSAGSLYRKVLALHPAMAESWQNLNLIYANAGQWKQAHTSGWATIRCGTGINLQTAFRTATAAFFVQRYEDAETLFAHCLDSGGPQREVLVNYGMCLVTRKKYRRIIDRFTPLVAKGEHLDTIHFFLGCAYGCLEDHARAVSHFKDVLRINPDYKGVRDNLSLMIGKKAVFRRVHHTYQIDIVGTCNLRCPSCPVGNVHDAFRPKGFMDSGLFRKIVEKAVNEHPGRKLAFDLFNWGDPLLHPEIDTIIRIVNDSGHEVRLSTNLNQDRFLEKAVRANPRLIKVSLSGYYQKNYGVTHRKGDITIVKSNMYKLRSLIDKYGVDTEVMVGYHMYKDNLGSDYDKMKMLAEELMYYFYTDYANLMPAENIVNSLKGVPLSSEDAAATLGRLIVAPKEVEDLLKAHTRANPQRGCILRSGFTTINYDGSVALCCAVYDRGHDIAPSYLGLSSQDLTALKNRHPYCADCMENGADMLLGYTYPEAVRTVLRTRFEALRDGAGPGAS